jgi:hypothetical protein
MEDLSKVNDHTSPKLYICNLHRRTQSSCLPGSSPLVVQLHRVLSKKFACYRVVWEL